MGSFRETLNDRRCFINISFLPAGVVVGAGMVVGTEKIM